MASTGKVTAGTGTSVAPGDLAWTNPGNITVDDASNADCQDLQPPNDSEYLVATNFGLTIPTDATIDGVIVWYWFYQDNLAHCILRDVFLRKAGANVGNDHGPNTSILLEQAQAEQSRGNSTDLWSLGGALTPAYCNASDFGWAIRVDSIGGVDIEVAYVDYMKIEVFYTEGSPQTRSPATVVMGDEGQRDYTNPDNVKVSDDAYATGSYFNLEQMEKLICSDFPFTIPSGATINSIVVHIEQFVSTGSGVNNWQVQVDKGAVPGLGGFEAGTPTETVIDVIEFPLGGSDPLWGNTWTAEEINNDLVVIVFTDHDLDDSADVSIDHISVTVTYTEGSPPEPFSSRSPTAGGRW